MLKILWISMLSMGIILLITSIILFIQWKIIKVINELSGKTAKKQIKLLQEERASVSGNLFVTSDLEELERIESMPIKEFSMNTTENIGTNINNTTSELNNVTGELNDNTGELATTILSMEEQEIEEDKTTFMENYKNVVIIQEISSLS